MDWNVVVTIYQDGFLRVTHALRDLGRLERTRYHNVLVAKADNPLIFLERVEEKTRHDPQLYDSISRVAPAMCCFIFRSPEEFDSQARSVIVEWAPKLKGRSFHVRLHRRGIDDPRSSADVERGLGEVALDAPRKEGVPAAVAFDNPDAIIAIDVVDDRAGLALWTREELSRYRMLRPD
jgi:tRNA(Ser,Leu) C12 N-acetylase TAN1